MKWLLTVLALAAVAAVGIGSCGPQRAFCPTTNPDESDLTCHENFDAQTGMGGQSGGACDGGAVYICGGNPQCTPC